MIDQHSNPTEILAQSEILYDASAVTQAILRLSGLITQDLAAENPIVMCVMGGAVVFSGQLLPLLNFPLSFEYVQASRYHNQTSGKDLVWKVHPTEHVKGRTVILLDDILDEGHTLRAIKDACVTLGAAKVVIAVLVEKILQQTKPIQADYIGLTVPDRYVFGCGMDVYGWWRNLPAIHALK